MSLQPPEPDERTVIRPAARSRSGRGEGLSVPGVSWGHTLPDGTRLAEFEITGVVGEGGFGIVYLAFDHQLERTVALKEYMPSSLASRTNTFTVSVKSDRHTETFQAGLKSFINEARLLARFDHPALLKVHRFWEANGTAYMVMPYYEGPTLRRALADMGHAPDEAWLRKLLAPLLDALTLMHGMQCYHRDIAPDNILLTTHGPLLLDFGAARRVINDMSQALTAVLKPGYAPIEQYGDMPDMRQGPWTDVYALASVVYCAITGKAPMPSVERLLSDRLTPLSISAAGRYSPGFLAAIDAALAVRPEERLQNVAALRLALGLQAGPAALDGAGLSGAAGTSVDLVLTHTPVQHEPTLPGGATEPQPHPVSQRSLAPSPDPLPPVSTSTRSAPVVAQADLVQGRLDRTAAAASTLASASVPTFAPTFAPDPPTSTADARTGAPAAQVPQAPQVPPQGQTRRFVWLGAGGLVAAGAVALVVLAGLGWMQRGRSAVAQSPADAAASAAPMAVAPAGTASAAPAQVAASGAPTSVGAVPVATASAAATPSVEPARAAAVVSAASAFALPAESPGAGPASSAVVSPPADALVPAPVEHRAHRPGVAGVGAGHAAGRANNASPQSEQCAELLQRASLESLSPEETAFLRRECK